MLLIKNGYMVNPKTHREGLRDILIAGGKIVQIHSVLTEGYCRRYAADPHNAVPDPSLKIIDASGCIVTPGLVDTHSHFRDPGYPLKEDIASGTQAAVKGGYTTVVMMANTSPCIDRVEILRSVLEKADRMPIHIYSCANVTMGMRGKELTDMHALAAAGAAGFTDDGHPVLDAALLEEALKKAARLHRPVSLHEEDPRYIAEPGINAGSRAAKQLHLKGADRLAETTLCERDLAIAVRTMAPLCIQHVSTQETIELVRRARKQNRKIHCEATPQHFTLNEEAVLEHGTMAKVNPPLRTESDRLAILDGLRDGTIDIIATDHAPHTAVEKAAPFAEAPSGMIGLETAFSLGIRELVNKGYLPLMQFIAMMTCNPAAFYQLPAGRIETGGTADLMIADLHASWKVTDRFASRSSDSPFIGEVLPGVIRYTIASGEVVYHS